MNLEEIEKRYESAIVLAYNNHAIGPTVEISLADIPKLTADIRELRNRLLTAAGDDLCRLTQEEIKSMTSGDVLIPPKDEFLASCERFHSQVAGTVGVNENCLTLAQLIAESERLRNLYSKLYQGIWLCPPDEVEFDDESADEAFTEACRQSTLFAKKG
jgi:hypothetical protein